VRAAARITQDREPVDASASAMLAMSAADGVEFLAEIADHRCGY
jgi:hypothetical protein